MAPTPIVADVPMRRRDQQREQTRWDLAMAAFEQAKAQGLSNVRVPQIAAAAGVSTRTFNNYFTSKEAAIVWPSTLRGARLAANLVARPADEPLPDALIAAVAATYERGESDGFPAGWLGDFRALVAREPALHGEYLKTAAAGESALADAIADRLGVARGGLEPLVLAGVVVAAERAAIMHWARQANPAAEQGDLIRAALTMALTGIGASRPSAS
jgi:AcrR family transcriptional regulator